MKTLKIYSKIINCPLYYKSDLAYLQYTNLNHFLFGIDIVSYN